MKHKSVDDERIIVNNKGIHVDDKGIEGLGSKNA